MPERDAAHDTEPTAASGAPQTPRVSGEQLSGASETPLPASSTRAQALTSAADPELAAPSEPSDTLLSAGKPAERLELLLEDRLAVVDERLREVDERLRDADSRLLVLERRKSIVAPEPRQKPWLWIAFLIALVVVFQLLRRVR
jgi:hypothetical protein